MRRLLATLAILFCLAAPLGATVSTTTARVSYDGNDSVTTFSVSFPFVLATDLEVYHVDADGAETLLTYATDYTVVGTTLTYPIGTADPLPTGERLVIRRNTAATQGVDLTTQGPFLPDVIEGAFDRGALIDQQLAEDIGRAVRYRRGSDVADPYMPVPPASGFYFLTQDSDGMIGQASPTEYRTVSVASDPETAGTIKGVWYASTDVTDTCDPAEEGSIAWVEAQIGSTAYNTIIVPPIVGGVLCDTNLTLGPNIHLRLAAGASLRVSAGVTLTLQGGFDADPGGYLYPLDATANVVLPDTTTPVYARWWGPMVFGDGATPSEVTANTVALQRALDASAYRVLILTGTLMIEPGVLDFGGGYRTIHADGAILSVADGSGYAFEDETTMLAARTNLVWRGGILRLNGSSGIHLRGWYKVAFDGLQVEQQASTSATVSGITQAATAVVTAVGHPFADGDLVRIKDVVGMTEINATGARGGSYVYVVANATADTFELLHEVELTGLDTTGYTAYTSGGTVYKHTFGLRFDNCFNVLIDGESNIHGHKGGGAEEPYLGEGIRVGADSGDGFNVFNNFTFRSGYVTRCFTDLRFRFGYGSNTFIVEDVAFIGHEPTDFRNQYGIFFAGNGDNLAIRSCKMESTEYGLVTNNLNSPVQRADITIDQFHAVNVPHVFNLYGEQVRVNFQGMSRFHCTEAGTWNVFEYVEAEVTCNNLFGTSSVGGTVVVSSNMTGTGKLWNNFENILTRTAGFLIALGQDNYTWDNAGAVAQVIAQLPNPPTFNGFRAKFVVRAAANLALEPGAAQIYGLTDTAGDSLMANTIGSSIELQYFDGLWFPIRFYPPTLEWTDVD